jgi:hypothetical protein
LSKVTSAAMKKMMFVRINKKDVEVKRYKKNKPQRRGDAELIRSNKLYSSAPSRLCG